MVKEPGKSNKINKIKIAFDMVINIIANALPILTLSLFLLPKVSKALPDEQYGLIVTVLAYISIVPATMGNILNNIRLLYDRNYSQIEGGGDFNPIL